MNLHTHPTAASIDALIVRHIAAEAEYLRCPSSQTSLAIHYMDEAADELRRAVADALGVEPDRAGDLIRKIGEVL